MQKKNVGQILVEKHFNEKIIGGMSWTWIEVPVKEDAEYIDQQLIKNGYETRGVYPPHKPGLGWAVRFR